jgi:hypothetical protein
MISELRTYFLYLTLFMIGLIIGRITMAIQYGVMNSMAKRKL